MSPPARSRFPASRITHELVPDEALVAVVGLSYAGLPSAIALRRAGFRIVGIDTSPRRLNDIRSGRSGLLGTERLDLRNHLQDRDFVLTDRVEAVHGADLVLISMPTTVDRQRHPNPETLRRTCAAVVQNARAGQTLVLSSTAYVGSTRELLIEPLAERGLHAGEDVFIAFSPERLDPGVEAHAQLETPRVIGAASDACFERAAALLRHLCRMPHRVSSPEAAEMVKLYESTFRAVNIALAFEMADACRSHEARRDRGHRSRCDEAVRLRRALPLRGGRRPRDRRRPALPAGAAARARPPRDARRRGAAIGRRAPAADRDARARAALALWLPAARRTRARRRRRVQGRCL